MGLARDADADARHASEQDVRIWRKNAAKEQRPDQAARAARDQTSAVIDDVLHSRESQRHHARVDYAVNNAVEILAEEQCNDQHTAALDTLFDYRGRDDGGQRPTVYEDETEVDDKDE